MPGAVRAARWIRRAALALGAFALLLAFVADLAETGGYLAASEAASDWAAGRSTRVASEAQAAYREVREATLGVAFPLLVVASAALIAQGGADWGRSGARRAMMAAPLFASGALMFAPFFDDRAYVLPEQTRSLVRLPILLMGAGAVLVLAWRHRGARVLALGGVASLVVGAIHAAMRAPSTSGPIWRLPNFAFEAAWGALAWALLAVALVVVLVGDIKSAPAPPAGAPSVP